MASYPKKMKLVDDEQQEIGDVKEHLGQKYDTPVTLATEENTSKKEQEMTGLMGQLELIPCKEIPLYDLLKKPDEKVPLEELPTVGFPYNCKHILNPD